MRLDAAASSCLRSALAGPARPATWLGVAPAALYLRTAGMPGVVALVAHDAVRLPCALLLPTSTAELPLTSLADLAGGALAGDASGDAIVGDGCLAWTGRAGPVVVRAVREWAPARVRPGPVAAEGLTALRTALPAPAALGINGALLASLLTDPAAAVAGLAGRGPGLTPAGDDVLAGFLVGARAFGLDAARARAVVLAMAPTRTTALSAALLWHAARGECIHEVAALVADLRGPDGRAGRGHAWPALSGLLRIGHTSGAALATGLATAATGATGAIATMLIGTASEVAA